MRDFETYAARERLESLRANTARKLTRQQRAQRRRFYRRTSAVFLILLLCLCSALWGMAAAKAIDGPQETRETVPMETPVEAESAAPAPAIEPEEDAENEQIEAALLARSHKIDNCTVTWYTADTCGKKPGDPAYGITASGLPVVEHLTVAVDRSVIPLYSDVFVQYADGTIEQLWATDTGVNGNHIDIYTPDYDYAIQMGRQQLTVWWLDQED